MPFDVGTFVEAPVRISEEIAILDGMATALATPDDWCQHATMRHCTYGRSVCVVGALNEVVWGCAVPSAVKVERPWYSAESYKRVCNALENVIPPEFTDIPGFNNSPKTTHKDVLDLIARARRSF